MVRYVYVRMTLTKKKEGRRIESIEEDRGSFLFMLREKRWKQISPCQIMILSLFCLSVCLFRV